MVSTARKMHVIEKVIKLEDERSFGAIESILDRSNPSKPKRGSAFDFVGRWSKEDAGLIEKEIDESCEQIHEDDWK